MLILIVLYVALCLWVGRMGSKRECGFFLAFIIALCTSPLLGAVIVLLFREKKSKTDYLQEANVMLDAGVITEAQHKEMVKDIMASGKPRNLDKYTKG